MEKSVQSELPQSKKLGLKIGLDFFAVLKKLLLSYVI